MIRQPADYVRIEVIFDTKTGEAVFVMPKKFNKLDVEAQRLVRACLKNEYTYEYTSKTGNTCIKRRIA